MPIVSKRQQRLMYAAAEGRGQTGIPKKVAKEYIAATPKSAYGKMPERTSRRAVMKRKSR